MATAQMKTEKTITLILSEEEAAWLMLMMRNPYRGDEGSIAQKVREVIFRSLHEIDVQRYWRGDWKG
jgi:hypothetical protein